MDKVKAPTRKEMFTRISDFIASVESDDPNFQTEQTEMIDFINHQIEMLSRKKPTSESGLRSRKKTSLVLRLSMSRWSVTASMV